MPKYLNIIFINILLVAIGINSSGQDYDIKRLSFNSNINSEFSPVYYGNGLVYTSNLRHNSLAGYVDNEKRLYKIYYIEKKGPDTWDSPGLLSPFLTSDYNDGPVSYSKDKKTLFFSRNNDIRKVYKDIDDTTNTLGIYLAEFIDGIWTNIKPAPFNNAEYNFTTPAISENGKRLFFSSNKPGGEGGFDLYYCDIDGEQWSDAVSLGEKINSSGDESFPYVDDFGRLYFSSDGLPGNGGLDIYFTQEINGEWTDPVHLDSTINSGADDFGILIDSSYNTGFFSSDRGITDDIYSFRPLAIAFDNCIESEDDLYCYEFYDTNNIPLDTIHARYIWSFGDGIEREGPEIIHCFPGPGSYEVILTIIDSLIGDTIAKPKSFFMSVEQKDDFSIGSSQIGMAGYSNTFELLFPDSDSLSHFDYYWNTGAGFIRSDSSYSTRFLTQGVYDISLGIIGHDYRLNKKVKQCITKKIMIFDSLEIIKAEAPFGVDTVKESPWSDNESMISLVPHLLMASNLSSDLRETIRGELSYNSSNIVNFKFAGSTIAYDPLLSKIACVLKSNPDIGLEAIVSSRKDDPELLLNESGKWARELTVYFLSKNVPAGSYSCRAGTSSDILFIPSEDYNSSLDGKIEFVFFRK